jgi:hypothetical protein
MGKKTWVVQIQGRAHRVEASHRYWTGRVRLTVDGDLVLDFAPGFAGYADQAFRETEHSVKLDGTNLTLRVTPNVSYQLDLFCDGRSVADGTPASPIPRTPTDPFFRVGQIGASIGFVALPYIFVTIWLFGSHSYEWGPRWFAANDFVLSSGIAPLMSGLGLYFINVARTTPSLVGRLSWLTFGGASLVLGLVTVAAIPGQVADVLGDPIVRHAHVIASVQPKGDRALTVTLDTGETLAWQWAFGLFQYPHLPAGDYELTLTPISHEIIGVRALAASN